MAKTSVNRIDMALSRNLHGPTCFDLQAILQNRDNLRATSNKMMYQSCKRASFWSRNLTRARIRPEPDI